MASAATQFEQATQPFIAAAKDGPALTPTNLPVRAEQIEEAAGESSHLLSAISWPVSADTDAQRLEQVMQAIQAAGTDYEGLSTAIGDEGAAYTALSGDLGGTQR